MRRRHHQAGPFSRWIWCTLSFCAITIGCVIAACNVPSPTLAPSATPAPTETATPTATATSTATSTATPSPTPRSATPTTAPSPSPTPTPIYGWKYWPNTTDFRSTVIDGDRLWIAALSGLVSYEPANDRWQVWTTADGLVDNTCESVVVWHDVLWIGTQGGVSRYDPVANTWRSYTAEHGLPGLHNTQLYVDAHTDRLWAGTFGGLASYDPLTDRWLEQTVDGMSFQGVTALFADADYLWIGVTPSYGNRGGLWRLDKSAGAWQDVHLADDAHPVDGYTFAGNDDFVWAVSQQGVAYEYNRTTETWRVMDELDTGSATYYYALGYHASDLWLWTSRGLIRYDVENGQTRRVPYPPGTFLVPQGYLAFGQNALWLPTQWGLYALDLSSNKWSAHVRADAPTKIAQVLFARDEQFFLSTGHRLGFFDPLSGEWRPLPHIPAQLAWGMPAAARRPNSNELWIYSPPVGAAPLNGVALEVWHYPDPNSEPASFETPKRPLLHRLLPIADEARLWFVADNALVAYDLENQAWHTWPVKSAAGYLSGAMQEEGKIWLLSGGETLIRFDTRQRSFDLQPIPFGRGWGHIASSEETIWLGGESNTLLSFDRKIKRWTEHPLDGACVGRRITALAANDEAVWAGGEIGIVRYDPHTRQQACYTREAGMLENEAAQIILSDGWVWFTHSWRGIWGYGPLNGGQP